MGPLVPMNPHGWQINNIGRQLFNNQNAKNIPETPLPTAAHAVGSGVIQEL